MTKFNFKLKDFILEEDNSRLVLFGDLDSFDCEFHYNKGNEWFTYKPSGVYCGDMDFLLEYRVCSISPQYKIVDNKIFPYLKVVLKND